ncbi:hypothetical protein EDC05_002217 [Coemansia umbellata]|uniref:Serine-threonine kinase receptor-associated protein n=1 Tax=Coemansia umbellata TaxID=1424467 RepID=A0ABQ8PRX9_9FUNG|nr:hypothetical protein EDC05_002217 [Coemansia umbellata]
MPSTTSSPQAQQIPLTCSGHTRPVLHVLYICVDGKPILRDGPTGDWLGTFLGHKGAVWSATLNADTTRAVTASADYTAKVWNAINGQELVTLHHSHIVKGADFVDDIEVITGGQDKSVRLFDITHPDAPTTVITHSAPLRNVKWSARKRLAVSACEKRINIIDLRTSSVVNSFETQGPVANMSLTNDGRLLSCAAGNRVLVWDMDTFKMAKEVEVDYEVSVAAIDPQRTRIITGGRSDLLIRVSDYESGKQLDTHKGHHGSVHDACFSPDGQVYATGSEDGTVRLWQTHPGNPYGLWQPRML